MPTCSATPRLLNKFSQAKLPVVSRHPTTVHVSTGNVSLSRDTGNDWAITSDRLTMLGLHCRYVDRFPIAASLQRQSELQPEETSYWAKAKAQVTEKGQAKQAIGNRARVSQPGIVRKALAQLLFRTPGPSTVSQARWRSSMLSVGEPKDRPAQVPHPQLS